MYTNPMVQSGPPQISIMPKMVTRKAKQIAIKNIYMCVYKNPNTALSLQVQRQLSAGDLKKKKLTQSNLLNNQMFAIIKNIPLAETISLFRSIPFVGAFT